MPDEDGATSWAGFLETVDEDMIVESGSAYGLWKAIERTSTL